MLGATRNTCVRPQQQKISPSEKCRPAPHAKLKAHVAEQPELTPSCPSTSAMSDPVFHPSRRGMLDLMRTRELVEMRNVFEQCLKDVADRTYDYLINTNVQLGADYSTSVTATQRVASGAVSAAHLLNCSPEEVVFGSSSTMLVENLTRAIDKDIHEGEEIIVTGEHEANVGPWKKLAARRNLTLKTWSHTPIPSQSQNPYAVSLAISSLLPLITSRTRIVAFTATSNILGSVVDVKKVVEAIRKEAKENGARKVEICIDCVAYAPHRRMDVRGWDVDYTVFSFYKVYGPHNSVLFVRKSAFTNSLTSLAHHFLPVEGKAYMLQPGGPGYESVYATTGVLDYLLSLSSSSSKTDQDIQTALEKSFEKIQEHETKLVTRLLSYLRSKRGRGVFIVGDEQPSDGRVPTISFVVAGQKPMRSTEVVKHFDKLGGVGIRYGHFYAHTLCASFQPPLIDVEEGVVRISLVHYNTLEEVEGIIKGLEDVLGQ